MLVKHRSPQQQQLITWITDVSTHLEREIFDVLLHRGVTPCTTDQPLGIEDRVFGVGGELILGGVSNQTLSLAGEGHIGWSDAVTLVIGYDLNTTILEHADTEQKQTDFRYNSSNQINSIDKKNEHAHQEYVVPRSMPTTVPTFSFLSSSSAYTQPTTSRNRPSNLILV